MYGNMFYEYGFPFANFILTPIGQVAYNKKLGLNKNVERGVSDGYLFESGQ